MNTRSHAGKSTACLALSIVLLGLAACAEADPGPRAWIDFPRDGASLPAGTPVTVISHAYARDGVAEILLLVDGTAYRRDPPAEAGATFSEVRQEWLPLEEGMYTLQVQSYDAAGEASVPDAISVQVVGAAAAAPTEVPTAPPTEEPAPTEPPPADTPIPTLVPTLVPTPVPTLPPTPVPTLPPTLPPTPVPTTPPTIPPTTPPDDTPPPVPSPQVPADEQELSCRSEQNLVWLPVSDPSSPVVYYVKLELQLTATTWQSVRGWGPEPGKQVQAEDLVCGATYRWAVRAQDGVGNLSAWSEWSEFTIAGVY